MNFKIIITTNGGRERMLARTLNSLGKYIDHAIVITDSAYPTDEIARVTKAMKVEFQIFERSDTYPLNPSAMFNHVAKGLKDESLIFLHDDTFLKDKQSINAILGKVKPGESWAYGKVQAYDGRSHMEFTYPNFRQDDKVKAGHFLAVANVDFQKCGGFPDEMRRNLGYEFEALEFAMAKQNVMPFFASEALAFHLKHKTLRNREFGKNCNKRILSNLLGASK